MDLTGMIFKIENKEYSSSPVTTEHWLITGPAYLSSSSYPAVKCSATGKAYKSTNGYAIRAMEELQKSKVLDLRHGGSTGRVYTLVREPGQYAAERANIDTAIVVTRLKNRISYLEAEIESDTRELAQAKTNLDKIEKGLAGFDFPVGR